MSKSNPQDDSPMPLEYRGRRSAWSRLAHSLSPIPVLPHDPWRRRWHRYRRITRSILTLMLLAIVGYGVHAYVAPKLAAAWRRQCAANLKVIANATMSYCDSHGGKYPASFEEILTSTGVASDTFVCPATDDEPADGDLKDQAAELAGKGHLSYIWLGKDVSGTASGDTVLAYEPLANHDNTGIHVLFKDYRVEWLNRPQAERLLQAIARGEPAVWPAAGW